MDKERYREYWDRLKQLSKDENAAEFFKVYCDFLEQTDIISESRMAIYRMVRHVRDLLN